MAVTLSYNKIAKTVDVVNYISIDGKDYLSQITTIANVDTMERTSALYIGKVGPNYDRGVSFYFDDIRIYDKVLTAEEIKSITAAPVTTPAPSTTASGGTTVPSSSTSPITGYLPVATLLPMILSISFLAFFNRKRKIQN